MTATLQPPTKPISPAVHPVSPLAEPPNDLASDIRLLDELLGQTIRKLAGDETLALFESIRGAAQGLRSGAALNDARQLRDRLDTLEVGTLRVLIRAFSVYFDLINLAEQHARVRAIRQRIIKLAPQPMTESAEAALLQLNEKGLPASAIDALLQRARIRPVFTAHPSEARRLTVLEKLSAISRELDRLHYTALLPKERDAAVATIREEIEVFWQSAIVRVGRPTVLDEVRQVLEVVEHSLFHVVPALYRELEGSLRTVFPDTAWTVPALLRFGSWIGGDRDGNPNVTHTVTRDAVRLQQETVLRHYREQVRELGRRLSHSVDFIRCGPQFQESLQRDLELFPQFAAQTAREPYRGKCRLIAAKLDRTLDHLAALEPQWSKEPAPLPPGAYADKHAILDDLRLIENDLAHNRAEAALSPVRELIRLVDVFGTHLMTLDVRQHANRHRQAMSEVLKWAGVNAAYDTLKPSERFDCLAKELQQHRPLIPAHLPFTPETNEVIQTFRMIAAILEQQCADAIENYIISGAGDSADLLEVLIFAREAQLFQPENGISRINIVPLFETLDALRTGISIMQRLNLNPVYRRHVQLRGDFQEIMIGYSDSNKESGFVQSAWALYVVQRELAVFSQRTGIQIQVFHGRGGAIGRGGGPANYAILAQPRGSINGRLRITEQGEMIADRYGHPAIAERHLDQVINAVLRASLSQGEEKTNVTWEWVMNKLSERACRHYRALVYETPAFLQYFGQATPISEVSQLKIGSRPARRSTSPNIEDLRAIPWVFSWMQSRHTLPGWYGLGSAVTEFLAENPKEADSLRTMYQQWYFFRTLIDNAQMILTKADMTIARLYADLIDDQKLATEIYERIAEEYRRTVEVIYQITGQKSLLEQMPILQQSIARRNPYVDPLSFIQLVLLKRLRSEEGNRDEILTGVLESINGIASGLKNTG